MCHPTGLRLCLWVKPGKIALSDPLYAPLALLFWTVELVGGQN